MLAGFDLTLQQDPYLPTDTTSFYPKGIPVLAWFTGSHEEYHRPADDPDTLNYEGIERVTRFASNMVRDLTKGGERPDYVKVEKSTKGGNRDAIRSTSAPSPTTPRRTSRVCCSPACAAVPRRTRPA